METTQTNEDKSLLIDWTARQHLSEAAKWARFMSIVGFIGCCLLLVIGLFAAAFLSLGNPLRNVDYSSRYSARPFAGFVYLIGSVLFFFRCLYLYRFADKMKAALVSDDQELINASFLNLKKMYRYTGILTIVIICLYAMFFFALVIGVMNRV